MLVEPYSSLCVPAKAGCAIELASLLQEFIGLRYGQKALTACQSDITALHTLRNEIISQFSDDSIRTIRRIKRYLNLLMCLEKRIPINEFGMLINFTWSNCFLPHRSATFFSSVFERCSLLFCLAVAYNEYGGLQPIDESSGLAKAAECYQKSANIFEHLRKECPPAYSCVGVWDLSPECLDVFAKILLAQAEELRKMKAILENDDPQRIVELASHTAHLYSAASAAVSVAPAKIRFPKTWSGHLEMKIKIMKITAEHHASICAAQKGKYEEQIARKLRIFKLIHSIDTPGAKARVDAAAKNIKCEIDTLKNEYPVNIDTVAALEASMTLREPMSTSNFDPIDFPFSGKEFESNYLFCHLQAMACLDRLPEETYEPIITSEIDKLRGLTHDCNHILASFNLPASQLSEEELLSELSKVASTVRKSGGVTGLKDSMRRLTSLSSECIGIHNHILQLLREEEAMTSEFIEEFGRPPTDDGTSLHGLHWRTLLSRYNVMLNQANSTDQFLRDVLGENLKSFEILSLPTAEFDNLIKQLIEKTNSQSRIRNPTVTQMYADIGRLKLKRRNFELDFQNKFNEKMTEFLKSNANTRTFINEQLERLSIFVRQCTDCQKILLNKLEQLPVTVRGNADVEEPQLSDLLFAAETYEQLRSDVKQGSMFYGLVLRILTYFSLTLTKIKESREENVETAAISAFVNLIDEMLMENPDNSQADGQLAKSSESTGGSGSENDVEQASIKGFRGERLALPNVKERVVFPVKNLQQANSANADDSFTSVSILNPILVTYHLPTTGYPYRSGFLIPSWDYTIG